MLPAFAPAALLVLQCTGPYCLPDTDFERPPGADAAAAAPELAVAPDGSALLAWESRLHGEPDVLFSRRDPGAGGRWLDPPVRLDGDAPGAARSLEPRLATGPAGRVYAVWQDGRWGRDAVVFVRSTDGGRRWSEATRLGAARDAASSMASLAVAAEDVWVAWEDLRDGDRDIRVARSRDGGVTWSEDERVEADEPGRAASYHPQLVAWEDGGLLVVWWDERDGLADLYVRRRDAAGAWAPEIRLDPGEPGATPSRDARVAADGDRVLIAWREGGDGPPARLVVRESRDRGATWAPLDDVGRGRGATPLLEPGGTGWVAWLADDAGGSGEKTSIGGRIVEVPRPVRFQIRGTGGGAPQTIVSLPGPAATWLGAAEGRLWAARTGERVGRALLIVYERRDDRWEGAIELRFGLDLVKTDAVVAARSLRGAVGPDGAAHVAWVLDTDGAGSVGYFRLQP